LIGTGKFDLNISIPLVAEYEETLRREIHHISENAIADILDYICVVAKRHKIFYLWRPILKDPDDDFILELAVKSNSWIITYNKADFKKASYFNIKVMTPKEFLRLIGEIP
jgi:predicted nucleic acid-binding protein